MRFLKLQKLGICVGFAPVCAEPEPQISPPTVRETSRFRIPDCGTGDPTHGTLARVTVGSSRHGQDASKPTERRAARRHY